MKILIISQLIKQDIDAIDIHVPQLMKILFSTEGKR